MKYWLSKFKWYRKRKGGIWYKHQNTYQLPGLTFSYFWTNEYGTINRYTKVVETEDYTSKIKTKKA